MVDLQTSLLNVLSAILSWYVTFGCDRYTMEEAVTMQPDKCLYRNLTRKDSSLFCLNECYARPQVRRRLNASNKQIKWRIKEFQTEVVNSGGEAQSGQIIGGTSTLGLVCTSEKSLITCWTQMNSQINKNAFQ